MRLAMKSVIPAVHGFEARNPLKSATLLWNLIEADCNPIRHKTLFKYSFGQLPLCLFLEETNLVYGKMSRLGTLTISEYIYSILVEHFQSINVQSMIRM